VGWTPGRPVELIPAAAFSDDELAELFSAAYADYVVPFTVDAAAFGSLIETFDLDRNASRVAVSDNQPIGLVNLGLRGSDGWIGGLGVVPAWRQQGIGRKLMEAAHDEARRRGGERVWLEVIVENTKAVALYEQLGYAHVREVEVWSLPGVEGTAAVVDPADAHEWVCAHRTVREPWQRDDASLAKTKDLQGLMVDGAAAVVRVAAGRVGVVQLAGDTEALTTLLGGARTLGDPLTVLNLPVEHPAADVLRVLGGRVDIRQHEMVLAL
jgi:ribosomal protein S18 acetylase RimI-like enzyme